MTALRISCIVAILALLLAATQSFSQEEMQVVDNSVFDRPLRASALFQHDLHNETAGIDDCAVCHHLYEEGVLVEDESSEDQACSDCHSEKSQGRQPSLRRAYHLNCKSCHLERSAGPIMCAQCHPSGTRAVAMQEGE